MRVAFYINDKPRELELAQGFAEGCPHPVEIIAKSGDDVAPGIDLACMVGVKSRKLWRAHEAAGIPRLMFDKGYLRHRGDGGVWEFWRVAVNAHHPTSFLASAMCGSSRAKLYGLRAKGWRRRGDHILIAGSSAKYHEFYGLPDPTEWARRLVADLRRFTDRPIIYRPKPSWKEAEPIAGTVFSAGGKGRGIEDDLRNAWALVTHGSNACFEAVLGGVPSIILGDGVARPISSSRLEVVERPRGAPASLVAQWINNISYRQFTIAELRKGIGWQALAGEIGEVAR